MFLKVKMAHFIILGKFTEQGIRTVKDSAKCSETFKNSIEKAGGKLVSTYYTLGQYDGVSIVEASDDATIMSSLLSYESQQGSSTTMTLKAFTAEETATILRNL
jgi:uncharacterized protein with GYD domain